MCVQIAPILTYKKFKFLCSEVSIRKYYLPNFKNIKSIIFIFYCKQYNILYYKMTWILILFIIGLIGFVLNRKNIILMLISIEIMLLAITLIILVNSLAFDDNLGQLFSLFIIALAGAESAIGLSILVVYYRLNGNISLINE